MRVEHRDQSPLSPDGVLSIFNLRPLMSEKVKNLGTNKETRN